MLRFNMPFAKRAILHLTQLFAYCGTNWLGTENYLWAVWVCGLLQTCNYQTASKPPLCNIPLQHELFATLVIHLWKRQPPPMYANFGVNPIDFSEPHSQKHVLKVATSVCPSFSQPLEGGLTCQVTIIFRVMQWKKTSKLPNSFDFSSGRFCWCNLLVEWNPCVSLVRLFCYYFKSTNNVHGALHKDWSLP